MKKHVVIIASIVIGLFAAGAVLVFALDNDSLKPSKNHVTDYVSPYTPYAVRTLYDEQKRPRDIVIVDAKSGVSRASFTPAPEIIRYKIHEISSTIIFTLYNSNDVVVEIKSFDTKTEEWVK